MTAPTPFRPLRPRHLWLAFLMGLCLAGPAWPEPADAAPVEGPSDPAAFRLGPGDVVNVSVWKQPTLSVQLPVLPDGSLRYPLAGQIPVQGHTPAEVEQMLTERLREQVREAVVSVSVVQVQSWRLYIVGEVLRPGEYSLRGPVTLVQALAMASGLTPFAKREDILVVSRTREGETRRRFDYSAYVKGQVQSDIWLLPGDTVIVK